MDSKPRSNFNQVRRIFTSISKNKNHTYFSKIILFVACASELTVFDRQKKKHFSLHGLHVQSMDTNQDHYIFSLLSYEDANACFI
mmetsp:Transcript_9201/g.22571  ORF Transcript_9201/g.22571 Transcript_9201/m.22571 type:complete len:85 (+) Transcript_9201:1793-2047(+)